MPFFTPNDNFCQRSQRSYQDILFYSSLLLIEIISLLLISKLLLICPSDAPATSTWRRSVVGSSPSSSSATSRVLLLAALRFGGKRRFFLVRGKQVIFFFSFPHNFHYNIAANQSCSFNKKKSVTEKEKNKKLNTIRSRQMGVKKCCSTAKKIISLRIPTILRCTESMVLYWAPERQVSCWLLVSGDHEIGKSG